VIGDQPEASAELRTESITTIWKILIKARKLFIVFNAIIGALVVFKTAGKIKIDLNKY
jgi:hypothetical protein